MLRDLPPVLPTRAPNHISTADTDVLQLQEGRDIVLHQRRLTRIYTGPLTTTNNINTDYRHTAPIGASHVSRLDILYRANRTKRDLADIQPGPAPLALSPSLIYPPYFHTTTEAEETEPQPNELQLIPYMDQIEEICVDYLDTSLQRTGRSPRTSTAEAQHIFNTLRNAINHPKTIRAE